MDLIFMYFTQHAGIANCQLPIFVRLIVFKLAINNRQLAIRFCGPGIEATFSSFYSWSDLDRARSVFT